MVRVHCGRLLIPAWMSSGINAHKPAVLIALYSDDRGDSWELGEILESCETLPDPICSAGLCTVPGEEHTELLALTNCAFFNETDGPSPDSRRNLTLHLSRDKGKTWGESLRFEDKGGYSDIIYCQKSNEIKCICEIDWEKNDCFHPEKIVIKSFQIS